MNYTTPSQLLRIVGFLLVGAAALAAQPSFPTPAPAKVLIASNTPTNALFPKPVEVTSTYLPAVAETQKASAPVAPIVNSALIPSQIAPTKVTLASVKEHTSAEKGWFTAGAAAFPATIRTEPAFGLPANEYGAGATAVSFSFGRK
jgi:hypothetical protein